MAKTEKDLQEQKKKVEDFSKELKEYSDEELDRVAGGKPDHNACPLNCSFSVLHNRCVC